MPSGVHGGVGHAGAPTVLPRLPCHLHRYLALDTLHHRSHARAIVDGDNGGGEKQHVCRGGGAPPVARIAFCQLVIN